MESETPGRGDSPLSDLIERARCGDVAAFTELVSRYRNLVFGYSLSVLRDFDLAEDAAQEAFVAAYFSLRTLANPDAFPAWLRGIARHCCRRVTRQRRFETIELESVPEMASTVASPPDMAEKEATRREVLAAIASLRAEQREVVALHYLHGRSHKTIAAFLGVSVSTVNSRLYTARKILRGRLLSMIEETMPQNSLSPDFAAAVGRIIEVRGAVVRAQFSGEAPDCMDALDLPGSDDAPQAAVVQRLGRGVVTLLFGADKPYLETGMTLMPANRLAPALDDDAVALAVEQLAPTLLPSSEIVETGIKAVDLFCPLPRGGRIGMFGPAGCGGLVFTEELVRRLNGRNVGISLFQMWSPNDSHARADMRLVEPELFRHYSEGETDGLNVFYLLSRNSSDPVLAQSASCFDAALFLSPFQSTHGLYPAIDPLFSRSRLLDAYNAGSEHYTTATEALALLQQARRLTADPLYMEYVAYRAYGRARTRHSEFLAERLPQLDRNDRQTVERAQRLEAFLTQPFFVAEAYTGMTGRSVSRADTIRGCHEILRGRHDKLPVAAFRYVGAIDEAIAKAKS